MEEFKNAIDTRLSELEKGYRETNNMDGYVTVFNSYHEDINPAVISIESWVNTLAQSELTDKPDLTPFFINVSAMNLSGIVSTVKSVDNLVQTVVKGFLGV